MRKPGTSSLNRIWGTIFFLKVIVVSPIHFTVLALDAGSCCARGSDGRIGNLFERGANGFVQKFEAFRLRTHRQHVGGFAGQVEQSITHPQEHLFKVAPDDREPRKLAGFELILALLAPTFRSR